MYLSALVAGLRRLGRWLAYEFFQLTLWIALVLHPLGCLRSAFGGGKLGSRRGHGRAVRPRRAALPAPGKGFIRSAAA